MDKKKPAASRCYTVLYLAAALCLIAYAAALGSVRPSAQALCAFSTGWTASSGETVTLDDIKAGDFGGSVTLSRQLPAPIADGNALCFQTQNANVSVRIGDREVYRFESRENLSGKSYGVAFHFVGLSPEDAGQTVRIRLDSVLVKRSGGCIWRTYLGPGADYVRLLVTERWTSVFSSVLIFSFGILLLLAHLWLLGGGARPYDAAALGGVSLVLGLWCLNDTYIPQLITGQLYICRAIDRLLLYFALYPFICFVVSLTRIKRPVYRHVAFWLSVFFLALFLGLRYGFGIDTVRLSGVRYSYYAAILLLTTVILRENHRYCTSHGLRVRLKRIYLGFVVLAVCVLADVLFYATGLIVSSTHGIFLRFGLIFFIAMMLLQFLRWWVDENASIRRDRFINRALQYAVSANAPEVSIRALLEYLGVELDAKRTYIFEAQDSGVWHGTYEWFSAGLQPRKPELLDLPYEGLIDELYKVFKRDNRLIVDDVEAWREKSPALYQVLTANRVKRFVVGPLELNGELIGLFGVDDAPMESLAEIAEIIRLISYFFAQLIAQREEQDRLVRYSYYDALTGVKNRRACLEFEQNELDASGSYGYVMCDINGLKAANDRQGHGAGDRMITDVARSLAEVFGSPNVYRMGGDEFAVYGFEPDETAFDADVERAKALIAEKGYSASVGAVYCVSGSLDNAKVKAEADARMYREKELYYSNRNDRRRR